MRVYFRRNHESFFVFDIHGKSRAATWPDRRVARLDRLFYVLRIMIAAGDYDQVFDPARDVKPPILQKAEVSGAQERTFVRSGQISAEIALRFFRTVPISLRDAFT